MENRELIQKLKDQSTWRLLGLGIITYGVYYAHYIKWQTDKINSRLDKDTAISSAFITSLFIISYISAALFIPYIIVDEGHPVELISSAADLLWAIMFIVWGFKVRNRVNSLCSLQRGTNKWFHGFWTFLFTPLYFNYKVNQLNEGYAEQVAPADS